MEIFFKEKRNDAIMTDATIAAENCKILYFDKSTRPSISIVVPLLL